MTQFGFQLERGTSQQTAENKQIPKQISDFSVAKTAFLIFLIIIITFSNLVARLSTLHLVDNYLNEEEDSNTECAPFCSYFYTLSAALWSAEGFNLLINAKNYFSSCPEKKYRIKNMFKSGGFFGSGFIFTCFVDILSVLGDVLLLLVILPKTDDITGTVIPIIALMIPAGYNSYKHIFRPGEIVNSIHGNKWLVFAGCFSSICLYIAVIVAYSVNSVQISYFRLVSIIIYPFLSSSTFFRNWDDANNLESRKHNNNANNKLDTSKRYIISMLTSIIRLIFSIIFCFIVAVSSNDSIFRSSISNFSSVSWWILLIIFSTVSASYFNWCGCNIGLAGKCSGIGSLLSIITVTTLSTVACYEKIPFDFFDGADSLCVENNDSLFKKTIPSSALCGVYITLLIPTVVLSNPHIFNLTETMEVILPGWAVVYVRDIYAHGAGLIDVISLMNKRKFPVFGSQPVYSGVESSRSEGTGSDSDSVNPDSEKTWSRQKPYVFVCPTLFRETTDEMKTLFRSILRLNDDRIETNEAFLKHKGDIGKYPFEMEIHVFFDNCFIDIVESPESKIDKNSRTEHKPKRQFNNFVKSLVDDVLTNDAFVDDHEKGLATKIVNLGTEKWPYGLRLNYKLVHKKSQRDVPVCIHLKDPKKIQKGKRWSQCFYFYYLLQYRFQKITKGLLDTNDVMFGRKPLDLNRPMENIVFTDAGPDTVIRPTSFYTSLFDKLKVWEWFVKNKQIVPLSENKTENSSILTSDQMSFHSGEYSSRKAVIDNPKSDRFKLKNFKSCNSFTPFILALDGDIDFNPTAYHSVINKTIANPEIGVCCGRIKPQGRGVVYFYQKFEYAIGHWLQKSAEHIIGCVLCSPGCFSLIRGEAINENLFFYEKNERELQKSRFFDGRQVEIKEGLVYA